MASHRGPVVLVVAPARSIVASQVVEILAFQVTKARADSERLLQYTRVRLIVHVQRVPRVRIVVAITLLKQDSSQTLTLQTAIVVADVRRRAARIEPLLDDARAVPIMISIAVARAYRLRVVTTEESIGRDALRLRCAHATDGQFTRAGQTIPIRPRTVALASARDIRSAVVRQVTVEVLRGTAVRRARAIVVVRSCQLAKARPTTNAEHGIVVLARRTEAQVINAVQLYPIVALRFRYARIVVDTLWNAEAIAEQCTAVVKRIRPALTDP